MINYKPIKGILILFLISELCFVLAYLIFNPMMKKETIEDVPMTFYIQSTGMISTETNTSYLVRYTINKINTKSTNAIFNSEQDKFNFLLKLHDEGTIVWICDIPPIKD